MKPTHILVPIKEWKKFNEEVEWETIEWIEKHPKVDISEKGIIKKAVGHYGNNIYSMHEVDAYHQCAKDLLNTKS